jgi:hypothetical protein
LATPTSDKHEEIFMHISTETHNAPVKGFETLNWIASDPLPRDRDQSHRLHQPDHLVNSIDPITSRDIGNVAGHPSIVDGNLTIYFESDETRRAYENTPIDHPYARLPDNPSEELDRGG